MPSIPKGITVGPDNNLWTVLIGTAGAAKITVGGVVTPYSLTYSDGVNIVTGTDGYLWYTAWNHVGKINPADGTSTGYATYSGDGITVGADGNVWFASLNNNIIVKVKPDGVCTNYAVTGGPNSITTGPDGNLWFTEYSANKIARMTFGPSVSPVLKDFGSVTVASSSAAQAFTLTNPGTGTMNITSIATVGAMFAVSGNNCGSSLGVGSNCTVSVTFNPASAGLKTAVLRIGTNDGFSAYEDIALSGTGTAVGGAQSIPTVSEWGMLVLFFGLGGVMTWSMSRRRLQIG